MLSAARERFSGLDVVASCAGAAYRAPVAETPEAEWRRLLEIGRHPVYLTIDLDVFDPGVLPGTGAPEPGGIDWATFEALLDAIPEDWLVAGDVVELAPHYDPTGCSSWATRTAASWPWWRGGSASPCTTWRRGTAASTTGCRRR